ncbi:hypothetical protein [Rhizobium sp. YS-1r]|uniref:hypothetical protein n=1 Tax=Rhizobium sp. YS-1r TaxID=1532558 RepID=UPI00050EE0BA|nr:hypothetical protein [Rhizobium sp. YS-1r]KGD85821.1 hypothetical protein JL39_26845 [Rhizobium sp. YS-1r]
MVLVAVRLRRRFDGVEHAFFFLDQLLEHAPPAFIHFRFQHRAKAFDVFLRDEFLHDVAPPRQI